MLHQVQPKIQPSHTSGQRESEQESKLCPFKTLPVSSSMEGGKESNPTNWPGRPWGPRAAPPLQGEGTNSTFIWFMYWGFIWRVTLLPKDNFDYLDFDFWNSWSAGWTEQAGNPLTPLALTCWDFFWQCELGIAARPNVQELRSKKEEEGLPWWSNG